MQMVQDRSACITESRRSKRQKHACMVCAVLCFLDCMQVIALASRKGGAGKTILASHLAVVAEAAGAGPVALVDTDPQGGLAGWWNARTAETPKWIDPVDGLPAAVAGASTAGYGVLIIDTPPSVAEMIAEVIAVADLVVIPVRPSPNENRQSHVPGDRHHGVSEERGHPRTSSAHGQSQQHAHDPAL
jgi:VirC1 protein